MAYKFQLGNSKLGGQLSAEGLDAQDQSVTNVGDIKIQSLSADDNSLIEVKNNIRLSSSVALTLGNENVKIGANSNTMAIETPDAGELRLVNGAANNFIIKNAVNESEVALRMSGSQLLQFAGPDESIGMASDFSSLDIKSVATIKLSGSTVEVENHNGVDAGLQLGATLVTATGAELNKLDGVTATTAELNYVDVATAGTAEASKALVVDSNRDIANIRNLTLAGDLTVNGTTTTVNSTQIEITGAFVFDGISPGGSKTTFGVVDPTAARAINLADAAGTLVPFAAEPAAGVQLTATPTNLNLMGAGTGASATLEGNDSIIIFNSGSAHAPQKVLLQDIVDLAAGSGRIRPGANAIVSANVTISSEITLVNTNASRTLTMPDITDSTVGKVFVIKDADGSGASANPITVNDSAAGHRIDGATSITLESDKVAVSLVACKNDGTFFYSIF